MAGKIRRQAFVTATPCMGAAVALPGMSVELETTDDLPADAVGQAVTEAVQKAWASGIDPAIAPFMVMVTFR